MLIFKICRADDWIAAERHSVYSGSAKDKEDGFLHFSTASQLRGTLERHYAGERGILVIAAVRAAALGADLKWEVSRGGEEFPHLYAPLKMSDVVSTCAAHFDDLSGSKFAALQLFLRELET